MLYSMSLKKNVLQLLKKLKVFFIVVFQALFGVKGRVWFKDAHTRWELLEKRNPEIKVFEDIKVHVIEMPKIEANPKAT